MGKTPVFNLKKIKNKLPESQVAKYKINKCTNKMSIKIKSILFHLIAIKMNAVYRMLFESKSSSIAPRRCYLHAICTIIQSFIATMGFDLFKGSLLFFEFITVHQSCDRTDTNFECILFIAR